MNDSHKMSNLIFSEFLFFKNQNVAGNTVTLKKENVKKENKMYETRFSYIRGLFFKEELIFDNNLKKKKRKEKAKTYYISIAEGDFICVWVKLYNSVFVVDTFLWKYIRHEFS